MEDDGEQPLGGREVDVLVYVRERGAGAFRQPVGFEGTIRMGVGGIDSLTVRPIERRMLSCEIHPHSATWRLAQAFLMVLPAFRQHAAMGPARDAA